MALTNGDFELGDLTNWSVETTGVTIHTATVTTDSKQGGNYGCELHLSTGLGDSSTVAIYRDIPTNFRSFEVPYSIVSGGAGDLFIYVKIHNASHVLTWLPVASVGVDYTSGWGSLLIVKNDCDLAGGHWVETGDTGIKIELKYAAGA